MISAPDRRKIVMLINEARQAGARLEPACEVAGISNRTYQRWTGQSDVREDGRPTAVRPEPANKLTREETEKVLSICHDPEFASLPPGQIVPRLPSQIRGMYFYLYMIVDVYSRKIVGWEVHSTESAELGAALSTRLSWLRGAS